MYLTVSLVLLPSAATVSKVCLLVEQCHPWSSKAYHLKAHDPKVRKTLFLASVYQTSKKIPIGPVWGPCLTWTKRYARGVWVL